MKELRAAVGLEDQESTSKNDAGTASGNGSKVTASG
jgi:hypothetical protein